MTDRWDSIPRMLGEQCDGHGGWSGEVYAIDLPSEVRLWVCKSCWYRLMDSDGWPEQNDHRSSPIDATTIASERKARQ